MISKPLAKASRIFDRILNFCVVFAGIIVIFMMLSVCYDVVMRYFFNRPTIWVVDVASYCLLFLTFLITAWVMRRNGHVKIELIVDMLRPKGQLWLNGIMSVIAAITFLLIVWYSANLTWELYEMKFTVNSVTRPLKFMIIFIIPLGSLLLSIQLIRRACNCFAGLCQHPAGGQDTETVIKVE